MLEEIINVVLTLSLPITFGYAFYLFNYFIQRLPLHQRSALSQFAKMAVMNVEGQQSPNKKIVAMGLVSDLFMDFKLPIPSRRIIEIAVESAVFEYIRSSGA